MNSEAKYKVDDIVGICSDCMADCKILQVLPEKEYIATAMQIHHPHPEESFFGKNKKFKVKEKQILCKLEQKDLR